MEEKIAKNAVNLDNVYPQVKSFIIDEFNLEGQNCLFKIAIHWEIGHG